MDLGNDKVCQARSDRSFGTAHPLYTIFTKRFGRSILKRQCARTLIGLAVPPGHGDGRSPPPLGGGCPPRAWAHSPVRETCAGVGACCVQRCVLACSAVARVCCCAVVVSLQRFRPGLGRAVPFSAVQCSASASSVCTSAPNPFANLA
jgi:hypothetical protein